MLSTPDAYRVMRFSSRALPPTGRARTIEELHERGLLLSRFARHGEAAPRVDIVSRTLPGLRILTASYDGVRHESDPAGSGDPDAEDLSLCMILTGTSLARRTTQEAALRDGDAVLMSNDHGWSFAASAAVEVAGLRVPRSALAPLIPDLDAAVMRRIPAETGGLRLLRKYIAFITADDETLADPGSQDAITRHLYDLAALTLGANRDVKALAAGRTLGALRLAAIKADITANLHDGDLDVAAVAARNRVSARYLHKLFHDAGTTYSTFVLGQRLARAYGLLSNGLHAGRPISAIAYEVGFNDLSYFNRAFRRRYDATPSDVREVVLKRKGKGRAPSATPELSRRRLS